MNPVQAVPQQNGAMQVPGYFLAPAPAQTVTNPKTRPGYKARLVTSAIQALLGVTLVLCGIVVLAIQYPEYDPRDRSPSGLLSYKFDKGDWLDGVDRQSWAIWMGIVAVITSVFGFLSKRNQALISLYMVSSIIGCLVAFIGIIVAAQYIGRTVNFRNELEDLMTGVFRSYYEPCFSLNYYFSDMTPEPLVRTEYNECLEIHVRAASAHLPFYCIMLICFVVGFVVAIIGASSTCAGLECCSSSASVQTGQQFVYLQQAPVQMPPPQVNTVEPPPPYTSLNLAQPPTNQHLRASTPPQAHANQLATQTPADGTSDAYIHPDVGRRLQSSTLPKPPQQQHETGNSEYLDLEVDNPAYIQPDAGRRLQSSTLPKPPQQPHQTGNSKYLDLEDDNPAYIQPDGGGNTTYLEPNTGGRAPQNDSAYMEPDAGGSPQRNTTYIQPDDGGNTTYLDPYVSAYLEPDAGGNPQRSNTYIQPTTAVRPQDGQTESYPYDYADPREEQLSRNT